MARDKGYFEVEVPSDSLPPSNCKAFLLGGPEQLCSSRKTMASKIAKARGSNSYTLSHILAFFTSCPSEVQLPKFEKKVGGDKVPYIETSKPINSTLPREWGLLPIRKYLPFMPIIGIS